MNDNKLPERKRTRLKYYDYSRGGAYFLTICTKDRKPILSEIIVGDGAHDVPKNVGFDRSDISSSVGDGAHDGNPKTRTARFGNPYDVPYIKLTAIGKIVEKYILSTNKIKDVSVDQYIIMPDHIHMILRVEKPDEIYYITKENGTSKAPSPTNDIIPHVVSTFKRFCNAEIGENIFERSYADHIIRDGDDYQKHLCYMRDNPIRWVNKQKVTDLKGDSK